MARYIPLFFVVMRKQMNERLLQEGNSEMTDAISDSGWININLCGIDYITLSPIRDKLVLLILDNPGSHICLDCYHFCHQSGIIHAPRTSHRMQPSC